MYGIVRLMYYMMPAGLGDVEPEQDEQMEIATAEERQEALDDHTERLLEKYESVIS